MSSRRKLTKSLLKKRGAISRCAEGVGILATTASPLVTGSRTISAIMAVPILMGAGCACKKMNEGFNKLQKGYNNRSALMRGNNPRRKKTNTPPRITEMYRRSESGWEKGGSVTARRKKRGN